MKKAFVVALLLSTLSATGQNGPFLQPYAGVGLTNFRNYDGAEYTNSKDAFAFDFGAIVGIEHNRWQFFTGLAYMRTGARIALTEYDALGNPIGTIYDKLFFNQFGIPLGVGRKFSVGKKLAIIPSLEFTPTCNLSARESEFPGGPMESVTGNNFENDFNRISLFGGIRVAFSYPLKPGLSLTVTPLYQYMFTNILNTGNSADNATLYCRALTLNFGIRTNFGRAKKPARAKPTGAGK